MLLHVVSLLLWISTKLVHQTGHLMMSQLLVLTGLLGDLVRLLGWSLLLLNELRLKHVVGYRVIGSHEGVREAVGHAELLAGLVVVVMGHLALEEGRLLLRRLLEIVLIEGWTEDREL